MQNNQLVSARRLRSLIRARLCIVVDCRFDLSNPDKKREDWLESHIPGAMYAHLDKDLASPVTDSSGRHPLPDPSDFADYLASVGWSSDKLLVAYDDASNAIAARLWWLMRYFGETAALLDGGLQAWINAGFPLESGPIILSATYPSELSGNPSMIVNADTVLNGISSGDLRVLDARAPERYSGEAEPLDTKAGHIPGALNRPFQFNLNEQGCFKTPEALRNEFASLLGDLEPGQLAHSCGSGVTACHNLFAMERAGLSPPVLYPGSWSEWIRDPARPIETGAKG
jgi:thiosulfate/3-mercaptopyruvate sulfurtransferase